VIVVEVNPPDERGTIWTAPDGVRYRYWHRAIDAPVGRPITNLAMSLTGDIHVFESKEAAVQWVVDDVLVREGVVRH
jgi:hypothetical protein